MLMIGTKVATYGAIALLVVNIALYFGYWLIKRTSFRLDWRVPISLLVITIAAYMVLPYSPAVSRGANATTYISSKEAGKRQLLEQNKGKISTPKKTTPIPEEIVKSFTKIVVESPKNAEEEMKALVAGLNHDQKVALIKLVAKDSLIDEYFLRYPTLTPSIPTSGYRS